ncbi:hypothetical protein [Sorangium sp. So ce1389]|uniref:hypothetical protein n=1 Tax=Sorangium sp. So ce1389 TaxID=3133336 RepID=UPI003F5E80DA
MCGGQLPRTALADYAIAEEDKGEDRAAHAVVAARIGITLLMSNGATGASLLAGSPAPSPSPYGRS